MRVNKKTIIGSLCILIISMAIFSSIIIYQNNSYVRVSNKYISDIISVFKEEYPNVKDEEILEIINNPNSNNKNVFEEYGYKEDMNYIKILEEQKNTYIIIVCICIMALNIGWFGIIYLNNMNQDKKIRELLKYFKDLNENKYKLDILENDEKMFSKLKNEIYKTTILLKEIASQNEKEKIDLSNTLADISHQIKTPITSIRIMIDNIIDNPNMDNETRDEFIKDISKQVDWIADLSIALLKLAKLDAGTIKIKKENINVDELIDNIISNLSVMIEIKNIDIIKERKGKTEKDLFFNLDYKWQLEALTNILKNAIEYSDDNSKIYIGIERTDVFLKINIRDEGKGINNKDVKNIFKRFYKGKDASDSSIGIGLALSKSLIEKNDGTIKVKSKENSGTEFEIKYLN